MLLLNLRQLRKDPLNRKTGMVLVAVRTGRALTD